MDRYLRRVPGLGFWDRLWIFPGPIAAFGRCSGCGFWESARNLSDRKLEGRIGLGFDAGEVMREVDAQRALRESLHVASVSNVRQHYQKIARGLSGLDDVVRRTRMLAYSSLSSSIAQALEAQGLTSAHTAAWNLRRVQSFRTPALQSLLKSITTFGPIVVSPDYEDESPFDYHPDLQGWLIPETATESGEAVDVEELWTAVVAWAQGIAVNHRTEALLRVIGTDGRSFLLQVAGTVVGGLILYWILPH